MENNEDYKRLIADIIAKQVDILGPEVAIGKAKKVDGLKVGEDGSVQALSGDAHEVLQKVVDVYISLSGEIVKNILGPVFAKYPEIKLNLK